MLPRHRGLDDGLLHRVPVRVRRFRPETVEAEPALQLLAGVVPLSAPAAGRVVTGRVPEPAYQFARPRELVAHPGRHHRVAAGDRQPRQRIGQRPTGAGHFCHGLLSVGRAGLAVKQPADRRVGLCARWARCAAQLGEETVEGSVWTSKLGRRQPVPGRKQVGLRSTQRFPLVAEKLQRKTGVELGIVDPSALEPAVLIVLDQVVIGIAGEREGAETQRVHGRQRQHPQVRPRRPEVREIEGNQVMAENEGRPVGKFVELRQCRGRSPT